MKIKSILLITLIILLPMGSDVFAFSKRVKTKLITPKSFSQKKEIAQNFTLKDLNGNPVSLSDFRGKSDVLLVFWATWCPPCRREVPLLNEVYEKVSEEKLKILAINVEGLRKIDIVKDFVKNYGVKYTVLIDDTQKISQEYKIVGIPTNIIVGKNGVVKFRGHVLPEIEL
ncbi:TlpA disulfide reductase family protein [Candidatus Margulisiibacteriota bacterium]